MSAIDVVNAADAGYVPHTAAMLHSLFENNPGETIRVHFLHRESLDPVALRKLAELCAKWNAEFRPAAVSAARLAGLPIAGRYTQEAWYRVILAEVLPEVARAIWLDSDVIVRRPIRELWELDLGALSLAACPNAFLYRFRDVPARLGIFDRSRYFNSGVMLLDLARMRAEGAPQALRRAVDGAATTLDFADQDVLNIVYHDRYLRLPLRWNVLSHSYTNVPESIRVHGDREYAEAMADPCIVHFTGPDWHRPWFFTCSHPQRDLYRRHRAAAGWPPPTYPDRSVRTALAQWVPLRAREVLASLRYGDYPQMLSYLRPW